jgi:hypothetical protein
MTCVYQIKFSSFPVSLTSGRNDVVRTSTLPGYVQNAKHAKEFKYDNYTPWHSYGSLNTIATIEPVLRFR